MRTPNFQQPLIGLWCPRRLRRVNLLESTRRAFIFYCFTLLHSFLNYFTMGPALTAIFIYCCIVCTGYIVVSVYKYPV
jgi:hypothetical protein